MTTPEPGGTPGTPVTPSTDAGKYLHTLLLWHPIDGRDQWIVAIEVDAARSERERADHILNFLPVPDKVRGNRDRELGWAMCRNQARAALRDEP